jgi:hypothetical protein
MNKNLNKAITMILGIVVSSFITSCKSDSITPTAQKPVIKQEVKQQADIQVLKEYYASIAEVKVGEINYDSTKDKFNVNGKFEISRKDLLKYYTDHSNKTSL